jgi:hypothetical protein
VQHPDIYGASVKEPCYFGSDLIRNAIKEYKDLDEYECLYDGVSDQARIGEASTWYLFSSTAAREIKETYPDSRIIIMLRNPVDVMYSLHGQLVKTGDKQIKNFEEALEAEASRKSGKRIPDDVKIVQSLYYRDVVKFSSQVKRYFNVFGRESCKVILFEDFKKDTIHEYKSVLEFLEVDASFQPQIKIINKGKQIRSMWLHKLAIKPGVIQKFIKNHLPNGLRKEFGEILHGLNSRKGGRRPLSGKVRKYLCAECADDINYLGKLINRDLSHWLS